MCPAVNPLAAAGCSREDAAGPVGCVPRPPLPRVRGSGGLLRRRPSGCSPGEEAASEEGALQGVVAVDAPAAEAGDLAGRVETVDRVAVGAQGAGVEVGLDAAEGLAGEDVEF